jgi:nucleoside-diphosphate-sugar epimerase
LRIVITGANGFIGSNLTRFLMKGGHDVTAVVRKTSNGSLVPIKCKILEVDYCSIESIKQAITNQDIVIHSAALTRAESWQQMKEINVGVTEKIVEAVNASESIKQLIFISSQAAAGMGERHKPKTEEDLAKPITWYGKSKLMAEEVIKNRLLKEWTIIRPVSVYGPGDKDFLQTFKMMKNHISVSLGIRDKYINLIYIDELLVFINKCIDNPVAFHQVFFASDGKTYTHKMFSNAMQNAIHTYSLHLTIPDAVVLYVAALGELKNKLQPRSSIVNLQKFKELKGRYWTVSIDKARKLLDYNPRPNLTHYLHSTWIWYKEQNWL